MDLSLSLLVKSANRYSFAADSGSVSISGKSRTRKLSGSLRPAFRQRIVSCTGTDNSSAAPAAGGSERSDGVRGPAGCRGVVLVLGLIGGSSSSSMSSVDFFDGGSAATAAVDLQAISPPATIANITNRQVSCIALMVAPA